MHITGARIDFLRIPLRLSITHGARARRTHSDSIVMRVESADGKRGFGEAIVRDYVSGRLGRSDAELQKEAARISSAILEPLRGRDLGWNDAAAHLRDLACEARELPFLCAVETALLDLACAEAGASAYEVLGRKPVRRSLRFGLAVPFLPLDQAGRLLGMLDVQSFPNIKVKVGADEAYNEAVLSLCRDRLGAGFDIRVDANAAWKLEDAWQHLAVCARHGVTVIEQPFPASEKDAAAIARLAKQEGFVFVSDEGFLTAEDVASIARSGSYQMLNLRLSKNGGLSRVLSLAGDAEAHGLSVQLGCMVGETGILSALGRLAASLLPDPVYLEGGYDDVLLSENVTTRSFGFGPDGTAPILEGQGIGYEVDEEKLGRFTVESASLG